jgi:hypothetical protein
MAARQATVLDPVGDLNVLLLSLITLVIRAFCFLVVMEAHAQNQQTQHTDPSR